MIRKSCFVGLILVLLLAPVFSGITPIEAAAKIPRYEKAACAFKPPAGYKIECGKLIVLEDRASKSGRTIKLAVAIVRSSHPRPDPIVYLNGGPGGYTLKSIARYLNAFSSFAEDRDFIFFDQRGIGYSEPALECPEVTQFVRDKLDENIATFDGQIQYGVAVQKCHDRLVKQGIALSAYTTAASAADVNDLRLALGYKSWNLFGISYGTRLALIEMKSFPAGVRSVVLDSTIPPQLSPQSNSIQRAFDVLFDRCADDPICHASYPSLKDDFYGLVTRLTLSPVTMQVKHPVTGQQYEVLISGAGMVEALYLGLYQTALIPSLPLIIELAAAGDYTRLATLILQARLFDSDFGSVGMAYSVGCSERLASPLLCRTWNVPRQKQATDTVTSSLPTLVLAGEFDPVTPPRFGKEATKTLSRSYFFQFAGLGHGVTGANDCPRMIMRAFLDAPTKKPDSSCIAQMNALAFVPADF